MEQKFVLYRILSGTMQEKPNAVTRKDVFFLIQVIEQAEIEKKLLLEENQKMQKQINEMQITIRQLYDSIAYYTEYINNMWNVFQFHRLEFWKKKKEIVAIPPSEETSKKYGVKLIPPGMRKEKIN